MNITSIYHHVFKSFAPTIHLILLIIRYKSLLQTYIPFHFCLFLYQWWQFKQANLWFAIITFNCFCHSSHLLENTVLTTCSIFLILHKYSTPLISLRLLSDGLTKQVYLKLYSSGVLYETESILPSRLLQCVSRIELKMNVFGTHRRKELESASAYQSH